MTSTSLLILLLAYGMGSFNTGYYLFRLKTRKDIRGYGSGSTGARNVSRSAGFFGGLGTFLGDCSKGALAVYMGQHGASMTSNWLQISVVLAVVSGHIWPVQLRFRGGKGIATALGALSLLAPFLTLTLLLGWLVLLLLTRNFTLAGLLVVALTPLIALLEQLSPVIMLGVIALTGVLLLAHRSNLQSLWQSLKERKHRLATPSTAS